MLESGPMTASYKLRIWGARGTVPTPSARKLRYGGNTSCLAVARRSSVIAQKQTALQQFVVVADEHAAFPRRQGLGSVEAEDARPAETAYTTMG